jgi:hypothetical protein
LLIGREDLGGGEIKNNEIGENENDVETADYKKFFLNYTDRCAVSPYSANLIINKAATEIANTY